MPIFSPSLYCPTLHCNDAVDSVISQEATHSSGTSVAVTLFRKWSSETSVGKLLKRADLLAFLVSPNSALQ